MKMKFLFFVSALFLLHCGVSAQEYDQVQQQKIDSLHRVVDEPSAKIDAQEKKSQNDAIWENRKKHINYRLM